MNHCPSRSTLSIPLLEPRRRAGHSRWHGVAARRRSRVQPVLRALRDAGLHIVALHNHMTGEQPGFYFTHYWGKGPATELARGFRSALDAQAAVTGATAQRHEP